MTIGILIKESMSGWMRLRDATSAHSFSFTIRAFTRELFRFSAPRFFRGEVLLDGQQLPCHGELTLYLHGPAYWLEFEHPELGTLRVEGKKTYGENGLIRSLITCPMQVRRGNETIGLAEVSYQDSIALFPLKAIRFVSEEQAYQLPEALR